MNRTLIHRGRRCRHTRSKSKLEVPNRIEEPAIGIAPEPTLKRKKTEVKGGLSERHDVKVTPYTEGKDRIQGNSNRLNKW